MLLPACRHKRSATTQPGVVAENGKKELGLVYEYIASNRLQPPRGLDDLNEYEASLPVAYSKIQSGDYVVFWGVGLNSSAVNVVLAYEKDAAVSGGLVLMQDGTVKTLSAPEFQAAPKAR